ncbi:MAG: DUF429 domain-containing protein [bacterium]|nr:DUF429 domain-containing protein [bacterium]MCY3890795.1 DUF429 domain-containing protein [bacterium]
MSDVARVAGVDGTRGGWVMATTSTIPGSPVEFWLSTSFAEIWARARKRRLLAVAIDMPIGLPDKVRRRSDREAKDLLGPRRSSLFWTPSLYLLESADHTRANKLSKRVTGQGLSIQAFNLLPKVREVRGVLSPADLAPQAQPQAAEVHPETSLAVLAGKPMSISKHRRGGIAERFAALEPEFDRLQWELVHKERPCELHDLIDATAAAWTARRMAAGTAMILGQGEVDATGYPMAIWA